MEEHLKDAKDCLKCAETLIEKYPNDFALKLSHEQMMDHIKDLESQMKQLKEEAERE